MDKAEITLKLHFKLHFALKASSLRHLRASVRVSENGPERWWYTERGLATQAIEVLTWLLESISR